MTRQPCQNRPNRAGTIAQGTGIRAVILDGTALPIEGIYQLSRLLKASLSADDFQSLLAMLLSD